MSISTELTFIDRKWPLPLDVCAGNRSTAHISMDWTSIWVLLLLFWSLINNSVLFGRNDKFFLMCNSEEIESMPSGILKMRINFSRMGWKLAFTVILFMKLMRIYLSYRTFQAWILGWQWGVWMRSKRQGRGRCWPGQGLETQCQVCFFYYPYLLYYHPLQCRLRQLCLPL